jgi:hypothetical protein
MAWRWSEVAQWSEKRNPKLCFYFEEVSVRTEYSFDNVKRFETSMHLFGDIDRVWSDIDINDQFQSHISGHIFRLYGDNGEDGIDDRDDPLNIVKFSEKNFRQTQNVGFGFRVGLPWFVYDRFVQDLWLSQTIGRKKPRIDLTLDRAEDDPEDFFSAGWRKHDIPVKKVVIDGF